MAGREKMAGRKKNYVALNPASLSSRKNCSVISQLAGRMKSPEKIPITTATMPKHDLMYLERKAREARELSTLLKQDRNNREQAKRQRLHRSAATVQALIRGQVGKRLAKWQSFGVLWAEERQDRLDYGKQEAARFFAARERQLHPELAPTQEEPAASAGEWVANEAEVIIVDRVVCLGLGLATQQELRLGGGRASLAVHC